MTRRAGGRAVIAATLIGTLAVAAVSVKADIFVNNGGTALSAASSWIDSSNPASTGTLAPGSGDNVGWDATTSMAGPTTFVLNADTSWFGISVANASAAVVIDNQVSNLTLGAGGISVSGTSQSLALSPSSMGFAAGQVWTVGAGDALHVTSSVVDNGQLLMVGGPGDTSISGAISGSGGVTKSGTGMLTLSAANGYSGATSVSGGILGLDFSTGISPASNILPSGGALSLSGARVVLTGSSSASSSQSVATLTISTGASAIDVLPGSGQAAGISVASSLARTQGAVNASVGGTVRFGTTGTITLSAALNKGIIADAGGNAFATYGLGDWAATDGSGRVIAASYVTAAPNSANNLDVGANQTLTTYSAGTERFNSTDPVVLTQTGVGTVGGILVTPNSGGATITGSSVRPNHVATAGASLSIIQNSTAGSLNIAAIVANGSPSVPTSVVKSGAGTLVLSNAGNSYTGETFINEGTVSINANGDLGVSTSAMPVVFSGGTLLATASVGLFNGPGSGTRALTLNAGGGSLAASSGNTLTVSGVISGPGALAISNSGTVSLSGVNHYTGGTTVQSGTLVVTNASGSATGTGDMIINGGVFGGTGMVAGSVIGGAGPHTISPGAMGVGAVGTLTVGGLSTNANTTLAVDLGSPTGGSDLLAVQGNVTLGGGNVVIASQTGTGVAALGYFKVISYTGSLGGTLAGIAVPAISNNVMVTLDAAHDPGFIDIHRGFVGDANDDGVVDLNDLNVVLNNLGTVAGSWGAGNFDGAAAIDLNDLNAVLNHLGMGVGGSAALRPVSAPVPEAGGFGVLVAAGALIVGRRGAR